MPEPAAWPADRRITITDLQAATDRGERWSMLTSYDTLTAGVFEQAGVRALLVGDTSAEMVFGHQTTVPMTMDQLIPMVQAVVRGTQTALVVADLPFGSYEAGPEVAVRNAVRHLKEGGAQAVKLEGGHRVLPQVRAMTAAGIPVMGHLGLTPQSVNVLGGTRRVQGRGDAGPELLADAQALERAGAFAVVLESVPAELGRQVSADLRGAADTRRRHRRRPGLRRPDHGLAGHGRPDGRPPAAVRQALRRPPRHPARRRAPLCHGGRRPALPRPGAQLHLIRWAGIGAPAQAYLL
jgi:3-methyl-2-oxobutanoate hydroxymethyltransferase